ncbi:sister chromatid cohesion protein PDS5 homolog C-like isoform X2 [Primulina huaijiensis]|uniref:sister chromatid cohesion protein PDS5 homolog C-like isoform X2 n=1 Tax=Primulina huaijiensis TaxID=1492673 RepID=UPI003CC7642A
MASTRVSVKKLAKEMLGVGKKLQALPSAIDELLMLLEKAESILTKVDQQPPAAIEVALVPLMQMLITDEILHHADVNIQIAVACCFTELTRISAPEYTYKDPYMKELFQLCVIVLKHLSSDSGRNYDRALRMLETIAKLKSSAIILDIDGDKLIVQMFKIFFSGIRPNHPPDTFRYMEMIISFVIQESHKIPFKLLRPILDSVKMDQKNISPISWELGNAVFRNCSDKLQRPLKKAVRAKNLDVAEYAGIVTSLCQGAPSEENMRLMSHLGSGKDLIDLRIKVWWPNDREYYPGTIVSFDHAAKKHKIIYDDGDEEILFMDEETWEPLDDHQIQHSKKHDTDPPAAAKKPVMSKKKKGKSNPGPSKKHKGSLASERAKAENDGGIKSGEVSVPIAGAKDKLDAEMSEMNSPKKNDEKTETLTTETQPSDEVAKDQPSLINVFISS